MTYALIDIGSNTVKMTRYAADRSILNKYSHPIALLSHIEDRCLSSEGIFRLIGVLCSLKETADKAGDTLYAFATAAIRSLDNREEVMQTVAETVGLTVDVLSGEEEACLSLRGIQSTTGLDTENNTVFDLGGGSLEIAVQDQNTITARSFSIGALAMHRNYVKGVLPTADEIKRIYQAAASLQNELPDKKGEALAVGGSLRAFCHILAYENAKPYRETDPFSVTREQVIDFLTRIAHADKVTVCTLTQLEANRIHTIPTGLAAFIAILDTMGFSSFTVVAGGVREGYLDMLTERNGTA